MRTFFHSLCTHGTGSSLLNLALASLCFALPTNAQSLDEVPVVTHAHAIVGARVVQAPGEVLENATVVVRDGIITAIGPDAAIPSDALLINGDTLTVYPGFLLGPTHAGLPGLNEELPDAESAADPSFERAGITPQRSPLERLDPAHASIDSLRRLGFTTVLIAPFGRMIPGTAVLARLTGAQPDEMVLNPSRGIFAQFESAGGVYPSTSMGVLAQWRQLYREAERRLLEDAAYGEDPAAVLAPEYDPVHTAFFGVVEGETPVVFATEGALEIHRILNLQETLGFHLWLAGLSGAFNAMEALKASDARLFLTLDLPTDTTAAGTIAADTTVTDTTGGPLGPAFEPSERDTLAPAPDSVRAITPDAPESFFIGDFRTFTYKDIEDERRNLQARQRLMRDKYLATAAALDDAGLVFGFTSLGANLGEVRDNLRLMIEYGLDEESALAALTTDAATLLGLEATHGAIEQGKIANLVVTNGSYFDEETSVLYVFVEGERFEYEVNENGEGKHDG